MELKTLKEEDSSINDVLTPPHQKTSNRMAGGKSLNALLGKNDSKICDCLHWDNK